MDVVYGRSLEKKVPAFCNVGVRLHGMHGIALRSIPILLHQVLALRDLH